MLSQRVLVVDDHAGFRAAATVMLEAAGCDVVGGVAEGEETLAAVASLNPDLVLLDLQLPGIDGVTVSELISTLEHPPGVILISSREDAATEPRVVGAPTLGFVSKRHLGEASIKALLA